MKYIVIFRPDPYKEGTFEHVFQADGIDFEGEFVIFYRQFVHVRTKIAIYKSENVIYAGIYEQAPTTNSTYTVKREEN